MARIYPFRATRYNPTAVRVEEVVTQPYDKISPAMQQVYYGRSPYNLVRIILGLPELFDEPGVDDVYTRAARDFQEWRLNGILQTDNDPSIFAYSQRFQVPGRPGEMCERRGFIALGGLEDYSAKVVFRHEQTLSKPKSDRLNLLKATRAHFGQIFMLYSDPALSIEKILFDNFQPDIEVTDDYGVLHRVSRFTDPQVLRLVIGSMADKKLIIADGHHRYETAMSYAKEHAPSHVIHTRERDLASTLPHPPYPEAAVMMTFINMDSEGLVILPTHRVVFGLGGFDPNAFLERAASYFSIEKLTTSDPVQLTGRLAEAGDNGTALVAVLANGPHLLTAKRDPVDKMLSHMPERQRKLDVVQLHGLVLERLLGLSEESIRDQRNLRYVRDAAEAIDQVTQGTAQAAFLMNPATLQELREIAFNGEVMPQKSTDFYPKLLSGIAIYALD
ncbi:MAG: hypothetical protein JWM54_324 [Acidobacteriaceae bacterium]|nr:hypothetical protein [Acidobacteriaceae bacterium]